MKALFFELVSCARLSAAQSWFLTDVRFLCRSIQQQTVQELQRQIDLLRGRDTELRDTIMKQEGNMQAMNQKLQVTEEQVTAFTTITAAPSVGDWL